MYELAPFPGSLQEGMIDTKHPRDLSVEIPNFLPQFCAKGINRKGEHGKNGTDPWIGPMILSTTHQHSQRATALQGHTDLRSDTKRTWSRGRSPLPSISMALVAFSHQRTPNQGVNPSPSMAMGLSFPQHPPSRLLSLLACKKHWNDPKERQLSAGAVGVPGSKGPAHIIICSGRRIRHCKNSSPETPSSPARASPTLQVQLHTQFGFRAPQQLWKDQEPGLRTKEHLV